MASPHIDDVHEEVPDSTLSALARSLHHDSVYQMAIELLALPEAMVYNLSKQYGPEAANLQILLLWKHRQDPQPPDLARVLDLAWRRNINISKEAFRSIGMEHPASSTGSCNMNTSNSELTFQCEANGRIDPPTTEPVQQDPEPAVRYPGVTSVDNPDEGRGVLDNNGHLSLSGFSKLMKGQVVFRGRLLNYELRLQKHLTWKVTLFEPSSGAEVLEGGRQSRKGDAMRNALYKLACLP